MVLGRYVSLQIQFLWFLCLLAQAECLVNLIQESRENRQFLLIRQSPERVSTNS